MAIQEQIKRLQEEIDSFFQKYDPNNQEHILLLFAYRRILDSFENPVIKSFFNDYRERIESLVKKLTSERLLWCAQLFDIDIYFNRFLDNYEQWEKYEITLMELIDTAVYSIVLLTGFDELAYYGGGNLVSFDECADQDAKHHNNFSKSFVWIPMFNENDRRYYFDSLRDDVEDVV